MKMPRSQKIIPIHAFKDNYIWMFFDSVTKKAWVVDPGDAKPVIETLKKQGLELTGILITHHHRDHSGGIDELLQYYGKNVSVIGSEVSRIESVTYRVQTGDDVICGAVQLKALEIPGHTLDHVAYYNDEILFCGDTLFSAGCGKVFEGTYQQMYQSLMKLMDLPDAIKIYCGHEYTLANLQFAEKIEPFNLQVLEAMRVVKNLRKDNLPTLPSTLHAEKQINPFLRCDQPTVSHAAEEYARRELATPVEVFACLREWKNSL